MEQKKENKKILTPDNRGIFYLAWVFHHVDIFVLNLSKTFFAFVYFYFYNIILTLLN